MDRMDPPEALEFELLVAVTKTIGYRIEVGFRFGPSPDEACGNSA